MNLNPWHTIYQTENIPYIKNYISYSIKKIVQMTQMAHRSMLVSLSYSARPFSIPD